jgi:hypothetical protein
MALPVLAGLALLCIDWFTSWHATPHMSIRLIFSVIDAETGRPIPSAVIRLSGHDPGYTLTTAKNGSAGFVYRDAPVEMSRSWLHGPHRAVDYPWTVSVSAPDYEGLVDDLNNLTRDGRYHYQDTPPPILLRLRKRVPKP